jgi:hypothetical protein
VTIAIALGSAVTPFRRKVVVKARAARCRPAVREAQPGQGQRRQRRRAAGYVRAAGASGAGPGGSEVLAEVIRAGGQVIADPARPRVVVPPALKPFVLAHKAALRVLVLSGELPTAIQPPPRRPYHRMGDYAFPWPDALPELGRRTVGPFAMRSDCSTWSWVRYGSMVLCLDCAPPGRTPGSSPLVQRHRCGCVVE